MDRRCSCGEERFVHNLSDKIVGYCSSCGREEFEPKEPTPVAPVLSLSRAAILKKIKAPLAEEPVKKMKPARDRTDYTKSRRAR